MELLLAFLVNAYYILGSIIIVFFAMKYALEQMNSGLDLVKAISRVVGFIIFFLALVFVLPSLFEFGVNKTMGRMQDSTTSRNLIALVEDGSKILAQESVSLNRVEVDDTSLVNEATELYTDVKSNVQSSTGSGSGSQSNSGSGSQSSNQDAPQTNVQAAPERKPLVLAPEYLTATPSTPLVLKAAADALVTPVVKPTTMPLMLLDAADPIPTPGGGPQTYTVQAGDSLSKIASRFGVSVDALCQANDIRNCNVVAKGKKLVIP